MNARERFLAACHRQPVDRTPVWLMRQAGRYLPEYRALKERWNFLQMVRTPELAVEVTLQPLRRFAFDAAILFSDILVVPEALGQRYEFLEKGGVRLDFLVREAADLARLDPREAWARLDYVESALRLLKQELAGQRALLGFGGSPWTLACYMIEGGSQGGFATVQAMAARRDPVLMRLLEMLTEVLAGFFRRQAKAGADALQIFDSQAALCRDEDYEELSLRWVRELCNRLEGTVPLILFARGRNRRARELASCGVQVLSLDWETPLSEVHDALEGKVSLQGNLDPSFLDGDAAAAAAATRQILRGMAGRHGHIFNLGHGIHPTARLEAVEAMMETVLTSGGEG